MRAAWREYERDYARYFASLKEQAKAFLMLLTAGAMLCGVGWIVGADLLALYASLGDSNPYGAIGGLFVVMVWMNFVSQLLFYGAELCKVVATTSGHR